MKILCDETGHYESTVTINGEDFWEAGVFAKLTQRTVGSIRLLANKGNRIRKLRSENINGRLYIHAKELMEFPFVANGRPFSQGDFCERFYLDNETLLREEYMIKKTVSPSEGE